MSELWINEFDYDQIGTDAASFIEIKGNGTFDMVNYSLVLVNGVTNAAYATINLAAAGPMAGDGWTVVIGNLGLLNTADGFIGMSGDWLQNGAADGIALINTATGQVVEYLSYEGPILGTAFAGVLGVFDATAIGDVSFADSNSAPGSMQLTADGTTWAFVNAPTPGAVDGTLAGGEYLGVGVVTLDPAGAGVMEGSGGADRSVTLTLTRDQVLGAASVDYAILTEDGLAFADDNDFIDVLGTATFVDGQAQTTITLHVFGDTLAEGDEVFLVRLIRSSANLVIAGGDAQLVVVDNDGTAGSDYFIGMDSDDLFVGLGGDDGLYGSVGNDTLLGGAGADYLAGELGRDRLVGGAGADRFAFQTTAESPPRQSGRDTIVDFRATQHDQILLGQIDANLAIAEDQAFTFRGYHRFSGTAGEVRVMVSGSNSVVVLDVDGDRIGDSQILVLNTTTLIAGDFVL